MVKVRVTDLQGECAWTSLQTSMECPITCVTILRAFFQKEIHARTGRHARKKTASVRLIKLALRPPSEILSQ
eukprot:UN22659